MHNKNNHPHYYNNKNMTQNNGGGKVYVEHENDVNNCASSSKGIRCVLVGDACVGKTSLIAAYTTNAFFDRYIPTAFDNFSVTVNVDEKPLKLELFDTAGRSEFDTIRTLSYADANIFLLCFSLVQPDSLSAITQRWLPELRAASPTTPILLVGTQSDLKFGRFSYGNKSDSQILIDSKMISKIADQFQIEFIECSAITHHNLKEVFDLAILYGLTKRTPPRTKTLQNQSSLIRNNIIKNKNINTKDSKNLTKKSTINAANTIRGLLSNVVSGNNNSAYNNNNNENQINHKKINQKNDSTKQTENKLSSKTNEATNKLKNGNANNNKNAYFVSKDQTKWSYDNSNNNTKNIYENPEKPINRFYKNNNNNNKVNDNFPYQTSTSPVLYNSCAYDSGAHTERTIPSTTFKESFRKLVSMTRRFL